MLNHGRVHFVNTKREMEFVALPAVERTKFSGKLANETLTQFLEALGGPTGNDPSLDYYVNNAITQKVPSIACSLSADWCFEDIESDAWQRRGHHVNGQLDTDARELLRGALIDLDRATLARLGSLPAAALAAFWTSWQVRRHLADFCYRVILARGGDVHIDTRPFVMALRWAAEKLAAYAHEVRLGAAVQEPLPDAPENPGIPEPQRTVVVPEPAVETRTLVRPQSCEQHDAVPGSQVTTTLIPAQEATRQMAVASQDQAATESVNRGGRPKGTPVNADKLRESRELADLTQEGLAKECEVSLSTIQRGEAGERWDEDTFTKVAGVLNTRTGKNNPVSPKDLKNLKN
jgi:DNA-binding XRE family transcriptional regulator